MSEIIEMLLNTEGDSPDLTALIDANPVLVEPSADPRMSTVTRHTFTNDMAQGIHSHQEIANRYGFGTVRALLGFLQANPVVVRHIKERKAIWESDDAAELRIRKLAGHAVLDALAETSQIMMDRAHPASTRLDALKQHSRMAGADGYTGPNGKGGGPDMGGAGGGRFSINIVFANAGKTESFTTVVKKEEPARVIDAEAGAEA